MIRYTVNGRNSLLSIPWYVTALTVASNTCNEVIVNEFSLSRYKLLRSVVIGSNCFRYVPELVIDGLHWLESIKIGSSSFCFSCNSITENHYRNFHLMNCQSLRELSIDRYSFSDYHIFEMNNLPNLKSIIIGSSSDSANFYYVESIELTDLPSLESIEFGSYSFNRIHDIEFSSMIQ